MGIRAKGTLQAGLFGSCSQTLQTAGMGGPVGTKDPVTFSLFDPATEGLLFGDWPDIKTDISLLDDNATSFFSLDDTGLTLSAQNATVSFGLNHAYTVEEGSLELVIENGIVTRSLDSGVFEGLLPAEGSTGPLWIGLSSEQSFSYDLSSLLGQFSRDSQLVMEAGSILDNAIDAVPEPSGGVLFGLGCGFMLFLRSRKGNGSPNSVSG